MGGGDSGRHPLRFSLRRLLVTFWTGRKPLYDLMVLPADAVSTEGIPWWCFPFVTQPTPVLTTIRYMQSMLQKVPVHDDVF